MSIRRIGGMGVAFLLSVSALLVLAGSASADRAKTKITSFKSVPAFNDVFNASGLLSSSRNSCVSGREYVLTVKKGKGKAKTTDRGTSTDDGALTAFAPSNDGARISFRVPATAKCAGASAHVRLPVIQPFRQRDDVDTTPEIAGIGSKGDEGAFVGFFLFSQRTKCYSDRQMTLRGANGVLDRGRSSKYGSWALHLTEREYSDEGPFTITVAAGEAGGDDCKSGSTTYPEENPPRQPSPGPS